MFANRRYQFRNVTKELGRRFLIDEAFETVLRVIGHVVCVDELEEGHSIADEVDEGQFFLIPELSHPPAVCFAASRAHNENPFQGHRSVDEILLDPLERFLRFFERVGDLVPHELQQAGRPYDVQDHSPIELFDHEVVLKRRRDALPKH